MKSATHSAIEELRSLCLGAAPKALQLTLSGLQRMEEQGRFDAEEIDAFRAMAGFKWKTVDDDGNQVGVYNTFPEDDFENDIEAMSPTSEGFQEHLQGLDPRQVAVLIGTVVATALNVEVLDPRMDNFNAWVPTMKSALSKTLGSNVAPTPRQDNGPSPF